MMKLCLFILLFIFHFNLHARLPSENSPNGSSQKSQKDDVIIIPVEDVAKECLVIGGTIHIFVCHQTLLKSKLQN